MEMKYLCGERESALRRYVPAAITLIVIVCGAVGLWRLVFFHHS